MATHNVLIISSEKKWVFSLLNTRTFIQKLVALLTGMVSGAYGNKSTNALLWRANAVAATGTITLANADADGGAYTATINGVVATLAAGTAGNASTTLTNLRAEIVALADNLVSKHVSVSAPAATGVAGQYAITISALFHGHTGNAITLATAGTGAAASGARLTGGTSDALESKTF